MCLLNLLLGKVQLCSYLDKKTGYWYDNMFPSPVTFLNAGQTMSIVGARLIRFSLNIFVALIESHKKVFDLSKKQLQLQSM